MSDDLWGIVGTESQPVTKNCPDCHRQLLLAPLKSEQQERIMTCANCFKVYLASAKEVADAKRIITKAFWQKL